MKRILCSLLVATLPFGSVLADAPKPDNAKVTLVYQQELSRACSSYMARRCPKIRRRRRNRVLRALSRPTRRWKRRSAGGTDDDLSSRAGNLRAFAPGRSTARPLPKLPGSTIRSVIGRASTLLRQCNR